MVIALALTAVGVPADAVVADYAATEEKIEAILGRLIRSRTYEGDLKGSAIDRHRPRPETMKAFLSQVQARYGGVVPWLAGHGFGARGPAAAARQAPGELTAVPPVKACLVDVYDTILASAFPQRQRRARRPRGGCRRPVAHRVAPALPRPGRGRAQHGRGIRAHPGGLWP